jgi:uncharacterized protein
MKFVIIHGSFGSPRENWFPYLKKKLEEINQTVIVPEFPVDNWDELTNNGSIQLENNQSLKSWLEVFQKTVKIDSDEKYCFVGHSIGPLFILHLIEKLNISIDSAIFVCPFLEKLHRSWQIDAVNSTFYKTDFEFGRLKKQIPTSYVIYSDNDPYVDLKYSTDFADCLSCSKILVTGGGHLNGKAGFREFPLIYDLCMTRLKPQQTKNKLD